MASDELEDGLRNEIDDYIDARLKGLREEIKSMQAEFSEAFSRLAERASSGTEADAAVGVPLLENLRAAYDRGVNDASAEMSRTSASSDLAILKVATEELDDQRSQSDILSSLVDRAASFAPRVVFFVVKHEQTIGWRARGLEGTVGDNAVRDISVPLSANTVLGDVVNTRATWGGSPASHSDNGQFISRLGEHEPQRIAAIPLVARGKAVAVLYADSAELGADAISLEALETLVHVAGMAVELLAVARPEPAERPAARLEPAPSPKPKPSKSKRVEEVRAPAVSMVEPEATEVEAVQNVEPHEVDDESGDVLAPFANPLGTARRYAGTGDTDLPIEVSDDERPQHVGARRFAKLLVSEIKLYNESKVKEGRDENDLYERLRDTIDRSREMYNKRYSATVGSQFDYFHHELVSTLAEGDESKLGDNYPGVSA